MKTLSFFGKLAPGKKTGPFPALYHKRRKRPRCLLRFYLYIHHTKSEEKIKKISPVSSRAGVAAKESEDNMVCRIVMDIMIERKRQRMMNRMKLIETSKAILTNCMALQANEAFLVVADEPKRELGEVLFEAGKQLGAEAMLMVMKEREKSGQEPPAAVAAAMKSADVVVCVTEHSLTHTKARKEAAANGARLATMPSITADMFLEGAISADYAQVKVLTEKVTELLTAASTVRIEKAGKSLTFSIAGRNGVPSTGMYVNPGESGNLPSGEAYVAPLEGTAEGQIVVDGSISGIGKIDSPLLLTIEKGRITHAEGTSAERLLQILGDQDGRMLGEFGIGTNDKARITGVVLEDEKVYGTIHVAFGSNNTFGGTIVAGVHIDLVVKEPDVYLDDTCIMKNGKLLGQ
ncbi:leucyl aminopeptidase (aminopeptidase T) [Brevibacillus sp. CF112]|nr:leucyl aminopeptidase (aminopeptidase T) [Brevibacillus sp. CF112]